MTQDPQDKPQTEPTKADATADPAPPFSEAGQEAVQDEIAADHKPRRRLGAPWLVGGAFALALLLGAGTALLWMLGQPERRDFFLPTPETPASEEDASRPLPLPDEIGAPDLDIPPAPPTPAERPPPPSLAGGPESGPDTLAPAQEFDRPASLLPGQAAVRYPRNARGASGEVVLRVHVEVDGFPHRVEIERSSGSRVLDRAAVDAARRWRFEAALRDGEPVASELLIPIDFRMD